MTTGTPPRRKVRSDARLEQLTPEQHAQLTFWLDDENLSYTEVTTRLRQQFGLTVGRTAVAGYYRRHVQSHRFDEASESAVTISRLSAGQFDAATVNHARYLAYCALVQSQPDIATTAKLLNLVRRAEQRDIARERLDLAQQRHALREREVSLRARRQRAAASSATRKPESFPARPSTSSPIDPAALSLAVRSAASPAETDATTLPPAEVVPAQSSPASTDLEAATPPAASSIATTPAKTPLATARQQKPPQNSPLYSPYFALDQPPETAGFFPILAVAIRDSSPPQSDARNPVKGAEPCLLVNGGQPASRSFARSQPAAPACLATS